MAPKSKPRTLKLSADAKQFQRDAYLELMARIAVAKSDSALAISGEIISRTAGAVETPGTDGKKIGMTLPMFLRTLQSNYGVLIRRYKLSDTYVVTKAEYKPEKIAAFERLVDSLILDENGEFEMDESGRNFKTVKQIEHTMSVNYKANPLFGAF